MIMNSKKKRGDVEYNEMKITKPSIELINDTLKFEMPDLANEEISTLNKILMLNLDNKSFSNVGNGTAKIIEEIDIDEFKRRLVIINKFK